VAVAAKDANIITMCGCKNCQGITFLTGLDGRGIVSITAQEDGTFIYLYTDGTTYTSPDLTGPQGPPGNSEIDIIGEDDIVVTEAVIGGIQTFTVSRPKEFSYDDVALSTDISIDPGFVSLQYFSPVGYSGLSYTNTSVVAKTYKVHASYEHSVGLFAGNRPSFASWVDAALVKTVAMVNTVEYESLGQLNISGFLFYGPNASDIIGTGTPTHELFDNQGSSVEFRFTAVQTPLRGSFFKFLTLNPNETVTLMFRAKSPTNIGQPAASLLNKAQIMVEEL